MPKVGDVVLISNRTEGDWDDSMEKYYGHLGIVLDEAHHVFVPTIHEQDDSFGCPIFFSTELTVMVPA